MKTNLFLLIISITIIFIPLQFSQPDFNGSNPGCDGTGCHSFEDGLVSVSVNDLQVDVTLNGTTSSVAGELVDSNGNVVDVNNSTSNNPFTLTAPGPGTYIVNAGFKNPSPRKWDSVYVQIGITDVSDEGLNSSLGFHLFNAYPNPFNPSTTIKYSVSENSLVMLKIYNSLGEEIAQLVNDEKAPGIYEIEFDGSKLTSGIYFYELTAGSFKNVKKFILLK